MHGITRFNANGNTFDIPETEAPNFLKDAPGAQRTRRFTAGGNTYDIPDGEADAFLKDAPDAVETRTIGYRGADGTDRTVDVPLADMPTFLRRYNADETFAHDREQARTDVAAKLPKPDESPMWAGVRAFGEGLVRSVTDAANLWRETYGDSPVADALLGANANANKIVNGILGIPEDIESIASMAAGGENTAAGKWLKEDARAGRAYLESLHPTRISDAVGREDWGTIAGDKIGDISATIIKFAAGDKDPTKLFNPLVVSSAAADSYAQTYDNAIAHGKSVEDANYLANGSAVWNALMTMFMMRAFKGETAAVQRDVGKSAKDVLRREAMQTAKTGNVMGVQEAGNKAIEANAEGRNVTAKELATAYAEGLGEGALFHSVNALGAQISEYGHTAERRAEWVEEFRDHILNNQSDREMYLKTPMGDPMRAICESVQNGTLPDRRAFVSAGIPKELCKTEAQRREIAQNFIDTIGITADAKNARAAQNIIDVANMMGEGDPIALNVYREWRDVIEENSVPKDVRLWNGRKVVAERVDMGDGKSGYDIYHDAGDGKLQLITTSDEPLLLDAYADAKTDMMNYFGLETPKRTGVTVETKKLREQIEDAVKTEEPAKEVKNEAPSRDNPQAVDEPVSGEPAPAEAGRRDEGVASGDGADAASPRGAAEAVKDDGKRTSAKEFERITNGLVDASTLGFGNEGRIAKEKARNEALAAVKNGSDQYLQHLFKQYEELINSYPREEIEKIGVSKILGGGHDKLYGMIESELGKRGLLGTKTDVAELETPSTSVEATQSAPVAAPEAVKPTAKKRPGKVAAKVEEPVAPTPEKKSAVADPIAQEPSKTPAEQAAAEPAQAVDTKSGGIVSSLIGRHLEKKPDSYVSNVAEAARELDRSHEIVSIKSANLQYGILGLSVIERVNGKDVEEYYALDTTNGSIRKPSQNGLVEVWSPKSVSNKSMTEPTAQPKALAAANAEAKTADARRAARMETAALEDEIGALESIGNLSKKRQRQLDAYKAELEKRKAAEERPNLDDTPDEFDDTNDPLAIPIEERTKPDAVSTPSVPSAETTKPVLTPEASAKILGADAYNKTALQAKLKQWEAHPTEANAPHREAAKLMLEKLEGPKAEPETPAPVQSSAPSRTAESRPVPTATQLNELSDLYDAMKVTQAKVAKMRPGKRRDKAGDAVGDAMNAFDEKYKEAYGTPPPDKFYEMSKEDVLGVTREDPATTAAEPAPVAPKRRPGKKPETKTDSEHTFDYGSARKTLADWFSASPEERASMPIGDTIRAIAEHESLTLRKGIQSAINDVIDGIPLPNGKSVSQYDAEYRDLIAYAKELVGEKSGVNDDGKAIRPRVKQNGEGPRLRSEKTDILRQIDEAMEFETGRNGEVKELRKSIAEAEEKGNKKHAKMLRDVLLNTLDRITIKGDGVVIKVPDSKATYKVRTAGQLERLRENIEKHYGKEASQKYYSLKDGPTVDAAKLDDPAFREWSAKRGTKADDAEALRRDRVAYDLDQATDAAKRTGNWLGVKVVRETSADALPTANAKPIKDGGQVVGWYDPATKEVHLKPGADAKTVAHEVGWHATYDWAKANHPALAKTMEQYAANAPEALKAEIRKLYGRDLTPAELIEEIGAGRFEREHGRKLQKLLADRANRTWYAKVWDGIKDAYKAVLTKLGFNRVDLDEALKDKTPEQAMDFLASAMARGQALGKMRPGKARDGARPMAAITPVPSPGGTGLFVDPQTRLNRRERWMRQMKYHNIALRTLDERLGRWVDGRPTDDSLFMHRINQEGLKKAAMDRSDFYENAIGKLMKAHGFGVDEVDAYLHYLGSPERNALVMRRDGRQDGSGESDQHWADAWHAVETTYGPEAQYIKQAAHIAWAMQEEGLVSRLNSGRISRDHYDTLKQNEPHHIPHKKDLSELDPELYSTSGGKGIRRNEFMSAHGTDGSDSPLVFMFREFRDAELGSRENEWRIRLADAVRQNPDLGRIRSAQRMENGLVQLNGDIGMGLKLEQKKEMHHPADGGDPNLVLFKEGGELKAIELNGDFGSDIADAVTGRSIVDFKPDGLQGKVKKISRAYANTATSWSPTFGFGNFAKDKVEVGLHNVGDFGYGRLATIPQGFAEAAGDMTGTSSMMRELKRYIGDRSFDTTTADGRLLKEFVESGGPIGGAASEGFQDTLKRFDRFNLASKQGKLKMMWETFQNFNERMEMINRLRNFKTARDHGMSPSQAAFKSRQDSTDFNAFGRQKWMNTVWNFSNSVTGGTLASMVRVAKGASSKRVIGTLAALGVLEALTEYMLNGNEEKEELEGKSIGKDMSEYERANAITIRKGEHFFRLPIHAGPYSIIKYAFNGATRVALGMMDAKEYAKNLASEVRDTAKHFTGTGDVAGGDEEDLPVLNALGAPDMGQSFAPSMLQPAVQIKEKKTFSGAPMESYQQPNDPEPKSWNGRKDTEIGYKWMAQAQNAIGGGDRHLKGGAGGSADTSPEVFKAAFEGVFKNTGKDAMQTFDVLKNLATGHLPELRNVPVVNRFVRKVQPNDRRYYETLKKYDAIVNKATKETDGAEARRWVRQHPSGFFQLDENGARQRTELDNLIKKVEFYKKMSKGYKPVMTGETTEIGLPQVARWEPAELTRDQQERVDAALHRAQAAFIVAFRRIEEKAK